MNSCELSLVDLEHDKLRKENEELKIKNKQYRNFLEAVGMAIVFSVHSSFVLCTHSLAHIFRYSIVVGVSH